MSSPVVTHRRALHRIPERHCQLPKTLAYVEEALAGLSCQLFSPCPGALCAFFDGGKPATLGWRADMDALAIEEKSGADYASVHEGCMHACGHDGHTAIALELARQVNALLPTLPHNVLFLFQPAEETTGGAEPMCETGILEQYRVARVYGLHLWPGLPKGTVWGRPGPLMARSSEVGVSITGESVHISKYKTGRDALWAGAAFLHRAYAMAAAELPADCILRFGHFTAGTVRNAVADRGELLGTLRVFREEDYALLRRRIPELAAEVAAETGCTLEPHISSGYPPVDNPPALWETVCAALGADRPGELAEPVFAAEDFSHFQRRTGGLFFFLGLGETPSLHAPDFDFDDETVLNAGVAFGLKLLQI